MFKELQEDFDRWWVTASFQEKFSVGFSLALVTLTALSMVMSIIRPRPVVVAR